MKHTQGKTKNKINPKKKLFPILIVLVVGTCLILLFSLLFSKNVVLNAYASGTTYYVSLTGNDANSGTSTASPWKTINKVNSVVFHAGDQILFQGGQTFTGNIYFPPTDVGTATNPITVASYGSGKATINGGNGSIMYAYDTAGFSIHDITLTGSGSTTNTGSAINFYNDLSNNILLDYISIKNITVSGFHIGISIGGGNGSSGYSNLTIQNSTITNCAQSGIVTFASNMNVNQNVYVGSMTISNITGVTNQTTNNGNGIVLGSVNKATIEKSIVHDSGQLCTASQCAAGIWTYNSTNVTIQNNEVYNMHTGSQSDGDGLDIDINTSNSFLQYNYSHNNDGPGILLASNFSGTNGYTNNTVRYNISENDARKNTAAGAIEAWGSVTNTQVYNNTVYITPNAYGTPHAVSIGNWGIPTQAVNGLYFRNNIFQTTNNVPFVSVTTDEFPSLQNLVFQGNDYYTTSSTKFMWGDTTYPSLASWRTATNQEIINGGNTGFITNPKLTSPGNGGTVTSISNLKNLSAYKLQSSSPMINKGLNLVTLFSINSGKTDFYGSSIPRNTQYDIGAHEY